MKKECSLEQVITLLDKVGFFALFSEALFLATVGDKTQDKWTSSVLMQCIKLHAPVCYGVATRASSPRNSATLLVANAA